MTVGVMKIQIYMHGLSSLKQKRSIVKSLTLRVRNRFNVSVAEVAYNDNHTTALIAVAIVSNEGRFIHRQFDLIINFMQNDGRFYIGSAEREII
jgi:hypothetical protein